MATIGSKKQEKKISELSRIANEIFPDVPVASFKGAFRLGAKEAVEKSRFESWEEVVKEPADIRRTFFESLLNEAASYFIKLVGKENVDSLIEKLKAENEKYLKD